MILLTVAAGPGSIRIRSAGTRAARSGWPGPSAHRETRGHHVRLPARAICGRSTRSVFWGAEPTAAIGRPLQPWLDYLIRLGCNGLALNPTFAPETHGYDVVDYLRIDPRLGDDGDVEWLVDACHRRAIRVLFDGVFTHVGRSFPASGRVYAVLASKETVTGSADHPVSHRHRRGRRSSGGLGRRAVARDPTDPGDTGGNPPPPPAHRVTVDSGRVGRPHRGGIRPPTIPDWTAPCGAWRTRPPTP